MSPEQTPLTDEQIGTQAFINALTFQRDQAFNAVAQLEAKVAVLTARLQHFERAAASQKIPAKNPQQSPKE